MDIYRMLQKYNVFAIVVHRGPDGDAIGSALAWQKIINAMGKECIVIAPDDYPAFLRWLPGAKDILVHANDATRVKEALKLCDMVFCLDFNASDRMGPAEADVVKAGKPFAIIDHHRFPSDFAEAYYVDDEASSTAELIYRLSVELNLDGSIDSEVATCLYTGLVTDTGSFRYPSVRADVLRIAAALLATGMDHVEIYEQVYNSNRIEQLRLKGFALSERLKLTGGDQAAYIYLSASDLARFDFRPGDTEGLVNYALSIKGVHVAAFFAEKDKIVKISLRSKGILDVNNLAREHFKGGGHIHAAGGRSELSLEQTCRKFESLMNERYEKS